MPHSPQPAGHGAHDALPGMGTLGVRWHAHGLKTVPQCCCARRAALIPAKYFTEAIFILISLEPSSDVTQPVQSQKQIFWSCCTEAYTGNLDEVLHTSEKLSWDVRQHFPIGWVLRYGPGGHPQNKTASHCSALNRARFVHLLLHHHTGRREESWLLQK